MEITNEFMEARKFLFSEIPIMEDAWDLPSIVCIQHRKFIPCRSCMYYKPAEVPYSCKDEDIDTVRIAQQEG